MSQLEKLVREFAENVTAQTDAIHRGDPKTGNKHAKRYIRDAEAVGGGSMAARSSVNQINIH